MIPGDNVGPEERLARLAPPRGYPRAVAIVALVLVALGVAHAVSQWGEERDMLAAAESVGRVVHLITLSCGF